MKFFFAGERKRRRMKRVEGSIRSLGWPKTSGMVAMEQLGSAGKKKRLTQRCVPGGNREKSQESCFP